MTNSFNAESVLNTVKTAFAPVTDALKNFPNVEVPEAAREFVKKAAGTAQVRATEIHNGSEKVTSAIETAVAGSVSETAKISRNIQQAVYEDAQALFAGIDKLASAKSLSEVFSIQNDLLHDQVRDLAGKTHDIVMLGHNVSKVRAQLEAYGVPEAVG